MRRLKQLQSVYLPNVDLERAQKLNRLKQLKKRKLTIDVDSEPLENSKIRSFSNKNSNVNQFPQLHNNSGNRINQYSRNAHKSKTEQNTPKNIEFKNKFEQNLSQPSQIQHKKLFNTQEQLTSNAQNNQIWQTSRQFIQQSGSCKNIPQQKKQKKQSMLAMINYKPPDQAMFKQRLSQSPSKQVNQQVITQKESLKTGREVMPDGRFTPRIQNLQTTREVNKSAKPYNYNFFSDINQTNKAQNGNRITNQNQKPKKQINNYMENEKIVEWLKDIDYAY